MSGWVRATAPRGGRSEGARTLPVAGLCASGRRPSVKLWVFIMVAATGLLGCVAQEDTPEEEQVESVSITVGQQRLEGLLLDAMALVRPSSDGFDDDERNGPRLCDQERPEGPVFSTLTLGWEALAREEALAGLDAIGVSWAEQGFAMDYSRRERPAGQEILATTPDRYELIAIVGVPNDDGIVRFGVEGGTPCLTPDPK